MLLFHFLNAQYGLIAIERQRLKISLLNDLNDPFELLAVSLAEKHFRRALIKLKNDFAASKGIICFSKGWRNPVLWSHYADRHRGLCLAFEVSEKHLFPVCYSAERLAIDDTWLKRAQVDREKDILRFLCVKYDHWSYEDEVRLFLQLDERDQDTGRYFKEFSSDMRLSKIIIGINSTVTKAEITKVLGEHEPNIEIIKARAAFRTFEVVRDRRWPRTE